MEVLVTPCLNHHGPVLTASALRCLMDPSSCSTWPESGLQGTVTLRPCWTGPCAHTHAHAHRGSPRPYFWDLWADLSFLPAAPLPALCVAGPGHTLARLHSSLRSCCSHRQGYLLSPFFPGHLGKFPLILQRSNEMLFPFIIFPKCLFLLWAVLVPLSCVSIVLHTFMEHITLY